MFKPQGELPAIIVRDAHKFLRSPRTVCGVKGMESDNLRTVTIYCRGTNFLQSYTALNPYDNGKFSFILDNSLLQRWGTSNVQFEQGKILEFKFKKWSQQYTVGCTPDSSDYRTFTPHWNFSQEKHDNIKLCVESRDYVLRRRLLHSLIYGNEEHVKNIDRLTKLSNLIHSVETQATLGEPSYFLLPLKTKTLHVSRVYSSSTALFNIGVKRDYNGFDIRTIYSANIMN